MGLLDKYELGEVISESDSRTCRARVTASGREVLVHQLTGGAQRARGTDLLRMIHRLLRTLPPGAHNPILDLGDHDGVMCLVTETIPGFVSVRAWLEQQLEGGPATPAAPPVSPPSEATVLGQAPLTASPAPAPAPPSPPITPSSSPPSEATVIAPTPLRAAPQPVKAPPAEATRLTAALDRSASAAPSDERRPAEAPEATMVAAVPPLAAESGAAKTMFMPAAAPGPPPAWTEPPLQAAAGPAAPPLEPGAAPAIPEPSVAPAPPPPPPAGEFTRVFQEFVPVTFQRPGASTGSSKVWTPSGTRPTGASQTFSTPVFPSTGAPPRDLTPTPAAQEAGGELARIFGSALDGSPPSSGLNLGPSEGTPALSQGPQAGEFTRMFGAAPPQAASTVRAEAAPLPESAGVPTAGGGTPPPPTPAASPSAAGASRATSIPKAAPPQLTLPQPPAVPAMPAMPQASAVAAPLPVPPAAPVAPPFAPPAMPAMPAVPAAPAFSAPAAKAPAKRSYLPLIIIVGCVLAAAGLVLYFALHH